MNENQRVKGVYLAADATSGVFEIDPVDYPGLELMKPSDFFNELRQVGADEVIFSFFDGNDEEVLTAIDTEYGVNWGNSASKLT